ncbi:MAG: NAD(P)/FAD-dependent oxidoreductase [Streptosporangiales bacterium]|nr:NAD(P)/FAD-dependent oxidoreductase [Streptosporangiales bacterium]
MADLDVPAISGEPSPGPATSGEPARFDVVVVGAGFAGLYMLYRLRAMGLSAVVLEAGGGVGGTWYWNRYPGARCDSESYYYSYSFSEELQNEWTWSERFAGSSEILSYLNYVTDKFSLRDGIVFETRVAGAEFDRDANTWKVRTTGGAAYSAQFLITAVGCLSSANVPHIDGIEKFAGDLCHTASWPREVSFRGKRVGVIGTGSTGIQAIPLLARTAGHLTVFQRTANYSIPARNRPLAAEESDAIKADYPAIRALQRSTTNGHPYKIRDQSALAVSEAERRSVYEQAWSTGTLRFRAAYRDLLSDRAANETASDFLRSKIRQVVKDPETAEALVPKDHGFATKRPPIDTNYFETYNRPNVTLVDLKRSPITEITEHGLRTTSSEHELDAIVFATGFDAMTGPLLNMDIRTAGGASLRDRWREGPKSFLGLQVAGFPNMFTMTGPGSPSVLVNMPTAIEQHVDWISDCLSFMRARAYEVVEASEEAEAKWADAVREAADRTLLPSAASSWYLGANIPGKPRVFMPYAGGFAAYARICDDVSAREYEGFRFR